MTSRQPIIIIGMHRSGTTMVVDLLEQLGLFMGARFNKHGESLLFFHINRWLLKASNASWDNPEPVQLLVEDPSACDLTQTYVERFLGSPLLHEYLGWQGFLQYRTLDRLDFQWGWKDPVNTFTLPMWLKLYPEAKIIHIYRHGIDVANSLYVRSLERNRIVNSALANYVKRPWFWLYPRWFNRTNWSTVRCHTLDGGLSLWEAYLEHARSQLAQLENPSIELKFEDFLSEPDVTLQRLSEFCDLDPSLDMIKQVSKDVNSDRAYAYRGNPELCAYEETVSERLAALGYAR